MIYICAGNALTRHATLTVLIAAYTAAMCFPFGPAIGGSRTGGVAKNLSACDQGLPVGLRLTYCDAYGYAR